MVVQCYEILHYEVLIRNYNLNMSRTYYFTEEEKAIEFIEAHKDEFICLKKISKAVVY